MYNFGGKKEVICIWSAGSDRGIKQTISANHYADLCILKCHDHWCFCSKVFVCHWMEYVRDKITTLLQFIVFFHVCTDI